VTFALWLLLVARPLSAADLVQLGPSAAQPPVFALYSSRAKGWDAALAGQLPDLLRRYGPLGASPIVNQLALETRTPEAFAALPERERAEETLKAALEVKTKLSREAAYLASQVEVGDPAGAGYALLTARLAMLRGPLAVHLDPAERAAAAKAYEAARLRLSAERRSGFDRALSLVGGGVFGKASEDTTVFEAVAAGLSQPPAAAMTPRVAELRRAQAPAPAWDHALPAPPAPRLSRGMALRAKIAWVGAGYRLRRAAAQGVYVPLRDAFREAMNEAGAIWRKYISGREVDKHNFRWGVIEKLHHDGDFRGSLGHPLYDGMPEIMSPLIYRAGAAARIREQTATIGRDAWIAGQKVEVAKVHLSPMMGVSGMSFPQLSAQSHLSLIYIHLKLAKELGVRTLDNTGEGGPGLHLALLEGDRDRALKYLVDWNRANGQFKEGSLAEAKLVHFIDQLMAKRDQLFKEFSPEDLKKAQIVAQFGSALNGIRGEDSRVDFDKLRAIGDSPYVAMIQYKLKQAAKRGARVDSRKIDDMVAALREIRRGQPAKSPEINPDFSSYEDIAALLLATKAVTRKPTSLKFGVGDVADLLDFLTYLRDQGALPDHIQIDGRGDDFSPGSGNAPPGANTSLPSNEAVIAVDAILKKLGARDQVFVEATGDVFLPADGVEKLALGADGLSGARVWMNMGLGCAKVKACANGNCPYGIASRSDSLVGLSLDPAKIAPKGFTAGSNWFKTYTQTLAEAGLSDWRQARRELGLASGSRAIRVKDGPRMWTLDHVYSPEYVENVLRGALTPEEVRRYVFGR